MRIKVFIADDHALVRKGLRQIFEESEDIEVVGEAADYAGLAAGVREIVFDVLVLDISMPGRSGIDALKLLLKEKPRLKALIVSMYPEDQFALRALKAGAKGYLTKTSGPDNLVAAVRQIAAPRGYRRLYSGRSCEAGDGQRPERKSQSTHPQTAGLRVV